MVESCPLHGWAPFQLHWWCFFSDFTMDIYDCFHFHVCKFIVKCQNDKNDCQREIGLTRLLTEIKKLSHWEPLIFLNQSKVSSCRVSSPDKNHTQCQIAMPNVIICSYSDINRMSQKKKFHKPHSHEYMNHTHPDTFLFCWRWHALFSLHVPRNTFPSVCPPLANLQITRGKQRSRCFH